MQHQARHALIRLRSNGSIVATALAVALATLATALILQYLVYDDLLHDKGPLRIVGSVIAAVIAFAFVVLLQAGQRQRRRELLHRFETIAQMNDRIRNALQVIECATYATNPEATKPVRDAVDTIEAVLDEIVIESHPLVLSHRTDESLPKFVRRGASGH